MLGQKTANGGDGDLEPQGILPSRGSQRMGIVIGANDRITFILYLFSDEDGQLRLVLRDETGEADVG